MSVGDQLLHDLVLVLGHNSRNSITSLKHFGHGLARGHLDLTLLFSAQDVGIVHVGSHTQQAGGFFANSQLVSGDHLHLHTEIKRPLNSLCRIVPWRIVNGNHSDKGPVAIRQLLTRSSFRYFSYADSECAVSTPCKIVNGLIDVLLEIALSLAHVPDDLRGSFRGAHRLAGGIVHICDLRTLADRIERHEMDLLDVLSGLARFAELVYDGKVNRILILSSCSARGHEHNVMDGVLLDVRNQHFQVDLELILGQSTRLVRAKNVHSRHFLNSGDPSNDSLELGQAVSTNRHGDAEYRRHGNRNTSDQKYEYIVDSPVERVLENWPHHNDDCDRENGDQANAKKANPDQDDLEMVARATLIHECCRSSEKCCRSGGDHKSLAFTHLDDAARVQKVALLLAHWEGLSRHRRLVRLDVLSCNDLGIGRHNISKLDRNDIARNQLTSFD
mmetsp:Transcript_6310/g.8953  ORF Transcript_6310/g.8953 Transcript_6310/m.8953 type:complete len:445 (-) Transcript_6310:582-1916(-)